MLYTVHLQLKTNDFCNNILVFLNKQFGGQVLLATTLQSHTEAMPGLPSLGEKRWAHPLPLATIPPGAWHRYKPLCLCAPWHPFHGLICHPLTLAPSSGLACGRQLSGPGQHLSPLPFSHLNGVLSIVHNINLITKFVFWFYSLPDNLGKRSAIFELFFL